jgi:hypothetical protein
MPPMTSATTSPSLTPRRLRWSAALVTSFALCVTGCPAQKADPKKTTAPPNVPLVRPMRTAEPTQLEPDASPDWQVIPGPPGAPFKLPVLFAQHAGSCWAVHEDRVTSYDPEKNVWGAREWRLPAPIGTGAAFDVDHAKGTLIVLRGGESKELWTVDLESGAVAKLPPTPGEAGVGAGVALDTDTQNIYALRGSCTRDFWRLDRRAGRWEKLTRVGADGAYAAIGQSTGHILYADRKVLVFPDHHVQRYEIEREKWYEKVHISYGIRPSVGGGMLAKDDETGNFYVVQGLGSRTLATFDPKKPAFALQRPRLPMRIWGEGSRAVVVRIGGTKHLLVFLPNAGNRLLKIALDRLEPIGRMGDVADQGSRWRTMHEAAGSSLVRVPAFKPVLGIMGKAAGGQWYFGRLHNMRFMDPAKNTWTGYPGVDLFEDFDLGLCAAHDGQNLLYVLTGMSQNFVGVDQSRMTSTKLPPIPVEARYGAQIAVHDGVVHAFPGGDTREHWRFLPAAHEWTKDVGLPEGAVPLGVAGSAIAEWQGDLLVVSGVDVWRLAGGSAWKKVATLPWKLTPDGGAAAVDPVTSTLYAVEGFGSRRCAAVGLEAPGKIEELLLPDVASVPGARALVETINGRRMFAVHRGNDTHEILLLPLDDKK